MGFSPLKHREIPLTVHQKHGNYNDLSVAVWPHKPSCKHTNMVTPVLMHNSWAVLFFSSFPRQMSRQTLHINRNLTRGLFPPDPVPAAPIKTIPPQYNDCTHYTNTTPCQILCVWGGGGGGGDIFTLRKIKMPALVNSRNHVLCIAGAIYRLNISRWSTILSHTEYAALKCHRWEARDRNPPPPPAPNILYANMVPYPSPNQPRCCFH